MKYSEQKRIEFYECDENKHLKLPAMVDLMMSVSEHQLGSGEASTNSLTERGLGWVVTQYHIDVQSLPQPNDKITVTTDAIGYNRFLEYRNFSFVDEQGNELITAKSEWVLFDLKKRKMVSTDEQMMADLGIPLLKKLPRFPRLRPQTEYQTKRQYRVRYDDLDTNHHMTNGHYFSWFIDTLDRDFLQKHIVQSIDIKFNQEVTYGQEAFALVKVEDDGHDIKSDHVIEDEENKPRAVCELTWRKI
ncbi:thioesterase [Lactobacillus sp. ESL0731]|uniref:acyl-[acyl-carrier-protein] thioesterase n=1 Tax=unclassified Lactobacillus TaxID=2620435 RepID=UPI0023F95536|nr:MULTISPECIES: acyl-ACP thioesterase domain-containing protein [unclassified Lactobacillus]WEV50654.1 thioesterase [Lactobacillus sp. ESL0700]WEV61784.1 thioesterase [Lactobacillus sp. ESL0731]